MAKSKFKLLVYSILLLALFFSLINILVDLSGKVFALELFGLVVLLFLTLLGFVGYAKDWGERVFFFVFLLYLVNLVLMWHFLGSLYVVLLILTLLGFLLATPTKSQHKKTSLAPSQAPSQAPVEPHSQVFDSIPVQQIPASFKEVEEVTEVKSTAKKTSAKKTSAKHSPGKFIASKNSNNYHEPKCEWAKKIKKPSRIWFESKEEAWEKGYKAHSCIDK
jgi:predicted membrane protein